MAGAAMLHTLPGRHERICLPGRMNVYITPIPSTICPSWALAWITVCRGRDQIERVAGAMKPTHPDFRHQPIAEPEELGDGGRVRCVSGRPREVLAYAGTDFIVAREGRIAATYLFRQATLNCT